MNEREDSESAELLRRIQQGDEEAFEAFCRQKTAQLERRIARRLPMHLRRKVAVSDVLQEAFLVALQRLEDFDGPDGLALSRWLSRVIDLKVREAVRRYLDTAKRDLDREDSDAGISRLSVEGSLGTPSETVMAEESRDHVLRALDRLPPDYAEVLRLVQYQQLSMAEASERIGRSREATKKLYGRALKTFARLLGDGQGADP